MKTFRWKNFPKSSGHVNAVLTFLLEPLPKVRTIFAYCQKLFEKLHLLKTLVFHQNVQMQTRECIRTPLYETFPPEVPKPLTGCARLTLLKLLFQKNFSKTSATQVNAVSLTPPFFFDQNSINLKNWNFFRKVLIPKFFFWAVQTNPPKIHAKFEKFPSKIEKKYETTNFSKKVFSQNVSSDM